MKTLAGYKLAETLGLTFKEVEQCSMIARLAKQHRKRMENECNFAWASGEAWDKGTERLELRIRNAVTDLYEFCNTFPCGRVEFEGDPRGSTVRYLIGTGREYRLD